ncbi:MAG TPA: hypothetical protein VFQ80_18805 [Thermomicrobiales bacterium]|jgi:hypothetical protein|nr:hypothetical protein [Thermomicrobiales bacterium]
MEEQPYTLARWRVRPGEADGFIAAWGELAAFFLALKAPPHWGTLLRSAENPNLFYSFGPWPSMETIAAMRGHPGTLGAIGKLTALCDETEQGVFIVAASAGEAAPVE